MLKGGGGDDLLIGGRGADTFRFGRGDGGDFVLAYAPGVDSIELVGESFGLAAGTPVAGVLHDGPTRPSDGSGFWLTGARLFFDADWSVAGGRKEVAAFFSTAPEISDFEIV